MRQRPGTVQAVARRAVRRVRGSDPAGAPAAVPDACRGVWTGDVQIGSALAGKGSGLGVTCADMRCRLHDTVCVGTGEPPARTANVKSCTGAGDGRWTVTRVVDGHREVLRVRHRGYVVADCTSAAELATLLNLADLEVVDDSGRPVDHTFHAA